MSHKCLGTNSFQACQHFYPCDLELYLRPIPPGELRCLLATLVIFCRNTNRNDKSVLIGHWNIGCRLHSGEKAREFIILISKPSANSKISHLCARIHSLREYLYNPKMDPFRKISLREYIYPYSIVCGKSRLA